MLQEVLNPHQDWCLLLCVGTLSTARAPQDDLQQATGVNVSDIIFCALDRAVHPDCDTHGDADCRQVWLSVSADVGACPDTVSREQQHGKELELLWFTVKSPNIIKQCSSFCS